MKYSEAIDMILDGGRAKQKEGWFAGYYIEFKEDTLVVIDTIKNKDYALRMNKSEVTATNWIVEKDGVVYEDSLIDLFHGSERITKVTAYIPSKQLYKIPVTDAGLKKLDDLKESGDLFFDARGTPLERVIEEVPTDALEKATVSKINKKVKETEDWLEKKILCVIRREQHSRFNHTTTSFPESKCFNPKCPFCFPEEKGILYARAFST